MNREYKPKDIETFIQDIWKKSNAFKTDLNNLKTLDTGENIDAGVQYRMPTQDYVCRERAKKEQVKFFADHPQLVGLSNDLPSSGSFYTIDELRAPILTTRDQDGQFRAFLDAKVEY